MVKHWLHRLDMVINASYARGRSSAPHDRNATKAEPRWADVAFNTSENNAFRRSIRHKFSV